MFIVTGDDAAGSSPRSKPWCSTSPIARRSISAEDRRISIEPSSPDVGAPSS